MARILIAEDERDIRDLITFTLRFAGHEVIPTENGEELLQTALSLEEKPALILTDVRMPKMTGYQACEELKKHTKLQDIPVVFLIGLTFAGPAMIMSALASNYDFFNYYFVLIITPMFIMCGVFYPVSTLPVTIQGFVQLLPLTHAVALTRPLVTGQVLSQPLLHLAVLTAYAAVSYYIAVVLVRRRLVI